MTTPWRTAWEFTRPHTVLATSATVATLWVLRWAGEPAGVRQIVELGLVLVVCLATNVYITGINQVLDVDIDRINKPHLPLPSGALSHRAGLVASLGCALLALVLGYALSVPLGVTATIGVAVGTAYSVPPVRLKRFPVPAALSILLVRGMVLTLGVWWHLAGGFGRVPAAVAVLAVAATVFGLVVAVFKDLPDREGDLAYGIRTFTTEGDAATVLGVATGLLTATYLVIAVAAPWVAGLQPAVLAAGEVACAVLVLRLRVKTDVAVPDSVRRGYQRTWHTFYLHHAAVAGAALAAAGLPAWT
ncbi:MAG TPA: homogentisate phytyltransferase [Jiangellales bacterium]|nr:homogentisate phytyltransferase [Jiangellales bacterium]